MPSPAPFAPQAFQWKWACALAAIVTLAPIGSAMASEAAAHAPADAHAHEPKAAARASAEPKSPASAPRAEMRDPLDVVRERLSQKLGAVKSPDTPNPNVLRVTAKAGADAHEAAPAARMGRARASAMPAAGDLAEPPAAAPSSHWDYSGAGGPDNWGRMKPEFATCSSGQRQSPIDIRDGIKVNLDPVQFDYKASGFRVIDNGHTVQVNVGAGNSIEVLGRRYDLIQFHFHRPSEERIDGKQFDMVIHLVHKDLEGRLAVVAVLLERGSAQAVVQNVWNNLPLEKGDEVAAKGALDLNALLPAERNYFTYMGSLTTPPCSEGVLWMVMKKPVQISAEQIGIFVRLYPMNARPIQSASSRLIKESN